MATKLLYTNKPETNVIIVEFSNSFGDYGLGWCSARIFNEIELTGVSAMVGFTEIAASNLKVETVAGDAGGTATVATVVRYLDSSTATTGPVVLVSAKPGDYTIDDEKITLDYGGTYCSVPEGVGMVYLDLPSASCVSGDLETVGKTIAWNGRTTDRASLQFDEEVALYKISDDVLDAVDFTNANCVLSSGSQVVETELQLECIMEEAPITGLIQMHLIASTGQSGFAYVISTKAADLSAEGGPVITESGTYVGYIPQTGDPLWVSQVRLPNAPDKVFEWEGNIEGKTEADFVVGKLALSALGSSDPVPVVKVSDEVLDPLVAANYIVSGSFMGMEIPSPMLSMMAMMDGELSCVADMSNLYFSGTPFSDDAGSEIPESGTYLQVNTDDLTMPVKLKFYNSRIPKGIRLYCPPSANANAVFATVGGENTFIKVDSNIYNSDDLAIVGFSQNGIVVEHATFEEMGWVDLDGSLACDVMFTGHAGTYTVDSSVLVVPEDGTYILAVYGNVSGVSIVFPNAVPRLSEYGFYFHKPYSTSVAGMITVEYNLTSHDIRMDARMGTYGNTQWISADTKNPNVSYMTVEELEGFGLITAGSDSMTALPTGRAVIGSLGGAVTSGGMVLRANRDSGAFDNFTGSPNDDVYIPPLAPDSVLTPMYTVTFQDWDGTVISQVEYAEGDAIVIPPDPMRESDGETNYIFKEWTPEVSATAVADAVYTAVYEETTSTVFTITFVDWDDSVILTRRYIEGTVIDYPPNPTRPDDADFHYEFDTWTPSVPATATANGTYKATYVATPCYLIEFVDWDGTVISSQRYLQDTVITVPENPTRASDGVYDYEFDKWTPEVFGVAVAHATYTATYTSTLIPVFYDVIFKDWDGTVISSVNYAAGDTVKIPPDPTRESDGVYTYAFSGWNPTVSSIASANVTYTATYTATEIPVYYDIVFVDWNGTIISNTPTLKNTNIVVPPDPVREPADGYEYTFAGWEPAVQTKATDHANYKATYSATRVYNDVLEIFANTAELVVNRNNSKNDDSTDTLSGVSWFTYSGTVCNNIYISGNHWFGLGSNAEHLKINRRDGATWYTYREEGELYKYYKFLRFRVSGYTVHNTTNSSNKITYDVILWDTGDISIYMVDVPTSSYDGIFSLGSLSYTKPTVENPHVTFYLQDDGTYNVVYEPIFLELPFDKKYLVKVYDDTGYTLYTVVDGALSALETKDLTAETFAQYGCDELPSGDLLMSYGHFEVIYWFGNDAYMPEVRATVTAIPYPQTVESRDYDMSHGTIHGIEKVLVVATEDVSFALSIDSGASWMCFKDGVWVALSENDSGMSAVTMNAITTEQWNSAVTTGKYRFRMTLVDETSIFTSLVVDYLNEVE